MIEFIDNCLKTPRSALAFKNINRLTILNPAKREGGLMTCFEED